MREIGLKKEINQSPEIRGQRLKAIRVSREINIKDAAQKLYMKESQLADIESGKVEMTYEQAKCASRLYGVSVPFIFWGFRENETWETWKINE